MTQSIIETRKAKEVETIRKDLSSQLKEIGNIEQINIKLNNDRKVDQYKAKEIETSLFKEINNVINDLNIERLSGIIIIISAFVFAASTANAKESDEKSEIPW